MASPISNFEEFLLVSNSQRAAGLCAWKDFIRRPRTQIDVAANPDHGSLLARYSLSLSSRSGLIRCLSFRNYPVLARGGASNLDEERVAPNFGSNSVPVTSEAAGTSPQSKEWMSS